MASSASASPCRAILRVTRSASRSSTASMRGWNRDVADWFGFFARKLKRISHFPRSVFIVSSPAAKKMCICSGQASRRRNSSCGQGPDRGHEVEHAPIDKLHCILEAIALRLRRGRPLLSMVRQMPVRQNLAVLSDAHRREIPIDARGWRRDKSYGDWPNADAVSFPRIVFHIRHGNSSQAGGAKLPPPAFHASRYRPAVSAQSAVSWL
jgi:hypothetical protein